MSEEKKLPERVVLEVTRWREGNEPENPWTVAVQANPGEKWNPDIYASYYPESALAAAREEGRLQGVAQMEKEMLEGSLKILPETFAFDGLRNDLKERIRAAASRAGGGK